MRSLFPNKKKRIFFAVKHPVYALRVLARGVILADERFLASLTGSTIAEIQAFISESFREHWFLSHLQMCESILTTAKSIGADFYAKKVLIQYGIVRALKPSVVLETGVANGVSTAYLLLALEKNGKGKLNSIDIGDGSFVPSGRSPGWIVPDRLRPKWSLYLGNAREVLPNLLEQSREIDVFIHDSLHTSEQMMFEFETVYPYLRRGGVLIADDATWNPAFGDFVSRVQAERAGVIRGVGLLKKGDRWR